MALLGCGLSAATGCVPGAAWLPDSSGFYYTGGKECQKLYHFDIAKGKARLLNGKTDTNSLWPAVRPDGKQIALARLVAKGRDPSKLQVALFDRDGKELKRSKLLPWRNKVREYDPRTAPQLFWAPQGDKVLVLADQNTGMFDVKSEEMKLLEDRIGLIFDRGPLRPDGKAFLAAKVDKKIEITLVDWDGKESKIKAPDELVGGKSELRSAMVLCPCLFASRWSAEDASVSWSDLRIRIDTGKKEATLEKINRELTDDKKTLERRYKFPESKVELRLIDSAKGGEADQQGFQYQVRIELVSGDSKKPRVLLEKAEACVLLPSPDRKTVVLRCSSVQREGKQDILLVVNQKGEVGERIDALK
jgi:hypothetical protein